MLDSMIVAPSRRASLERATARYEKNVLGLASFLEPRGIGEAAATGFRLGLVSDPEPGHERFVGWMSIPYLTPAGVVAMKFRRLDEGSPKYDSPAGQKIRLFNVMALHGKHDTVALCEGELDAVVCTSVVGVPAVGTWGTNWFDHHPRCFADFENVLIVADNDDKEDESNPGLKHAKKVQATLPQSRIVTPPKGLDLGEWVLRDGAEAVRKAMSV